MIENSNLKLEQAEILNSGDGLNWYVYCGNDPVNLIDPFGLASVWGADSNTVSVPEVNYRWPVDSGIITSAYGPRTDALPDPHPGIDLAGEEKQNLIAAESGTVIKVGTSPGGSSRLFIEVVNGEILVYKHGDFNEYLKGDAVKKDDVLGEMDDIGSPGADHLHFEIRPKGSIVQADAVDPIARLPERPSSITLDEDLVEENGGTLKNK